MVQKRETKAINKLCVREILSLSFVCGAYFFEFRGRNLVCFGIAYNFERMRTAFFTRVSVNIAKNKRNRFGIHGLIIYFFCFTSLSNGAKPIETVFVDNLSL